MRPDWVEQHHKNIVDRHAILNFASIVKRTLKKLGEKIIMEQNLKAVLTTEHHNKKQNF